MNKLKEINGKFYQEAEVVMLATDNKTSVINLENDDELLHINQYVPKLEYGNQHLYFLSNEKIKEGDNCILFLGENTRVVQVKSLNSGHPVFTVDIEDGYAQLSNLKKIIATTDLSLNINNYSDVDRLIDFEYNLPQPSQSFIQAYIKAYNEGKPITKVLVEIFDNGEEDWIGDDVNGEPFWNSKFEIKVNSSNEITIKKIKDSWTREELRPKFLKLCHDVADYIEKGYDEKTEFNIDNWIEENL